VSRGSAIWTLITEKIYTQVVSEDGKHYAAKLGKAV
jgi:hypothetical protein